MGDIEHCVGIRGAAEREVQRLEAKVERLREALIDAREAIAAVHHAGFDSERKRLAHAAVQAVTEALNA